MKKKFDFILSLPPRQRLLRGLARLHCGLLAGILFAMVFAILPAITVPVKTGPEEAFWRGILFAIPTALCYCAVKRIPALWQFLLAALGLCGLSWLLCGHLGGAVFMGLMCLFRVRARLAEEDEGPIKSLFDAPLYFALLIFAAAFFLSATMGLPELQRLSLLGGALYLLVCLAFNGVQRMDDYLTLNRDMSGLPERRIQRMAGSAVFLRAALAAVLLIPAALAAPGDLRIELPDGNGYLPLATPEPMEIEGMGAMDAAAENLQDMFGEPSWTLPEWVSYVLFGAIGIMLAAAVFAGVRSLIKSFGRGRGGEDADIVQRLDKDGRDTVGAMERGIRRPSIFDRSPNAVIRRRYRKAILRGKVSPVASNSPTELELAAGVEDQRLHLAYEKARYSEQGCSGEDVAALR